MLREIENIDAKDLDVLMANFLLQVRKRDGEQYEITSLRSLSDRYQLSSEVFFLYFLSSSFELLNVECL